MNIGYIGDKGQGKSYMLSKQLVSNLYRNAHWHEKKGLPKRMIYVMNTLGLNPKFSEEWKEYIVFFEHLDDIRNMREADVYVDDISMRLDSRGWEFLTQGARQWLYGSERFGCDFYFTAQKFSRVEITFRLLTDVVYLCTKTWGSPRPTSTKPIVKRVWGIINVLDVPKSIFQSDKFNQDEFGGGRMHWLSKKYTDVYDHKNISLSGDYAPLMCIERSAPCGKIVHIHK